MYLTKCTPRFQPHKTPYLSSLVFEESTNCLISHAHPFPSPLPPTHKSCHFLSPFSFSPPHPPVTHFSLFLPFLSLHPLPLSQSASPPPLTPPSPLPQVATAQSVDEDFTPNIEASCKAGYMQINVYVNNVEYRGERFDFAVLLDFGGFFTCYFWFLYSVFKFM